MEGVEVTETLDLRMQRFFTSLGYRVRLTKWWMSQSRVYLVRKNFFAYSIPVIPHGPCSRGWEIKTTPRRQTEAEFLAKALSEEIGERVKVIIDA